MSEHCPECGVLLTEGTTCQSLFDEVLSLEYIYPEYYGKVHFLTVACFMLQHGRYSDKALTWIIPMMRRYIEENLSPQQLRQIASQGTDNTTRTWKILRQPDEPPPLKVAWSMTIVDVASNLQDHTQYCAQIQKWARTILQDVEES